MIWPENLCRLCGIISSVQHSVFKLVGNVTIEYKIKKCLNISIFKDDYKPQQICNDCLLKVEQFSDFVDVCIEANQRLDSLLVSRNSWSEVKSSNVPLYIQQRSVIVNLKNGIENYTNESIDSLPLENLNVPLQDDVLQIVENTNIYTTNLQDNITNYMNTETRYVPYYPECNSTVLRHSSNVESLHNNLYSDNDMNYGFTNKDNAPHELINKTCTDYFSTENQLNFDKCFDENIDVVNFNTRDECVQTEDILKCKPTENLVSVESVRNRLNLTNEIVTTKAKPQKQHKCPHCDRIFMRRISLNSHIAIHTKNRPFVCSKCGKTFPIKSELTVHKKIHSDQYQCKICLKTFVVPSKLERHLRTHTKERPFKCNFVGCEKTFSDRSNLFEHKSTHQETRNLKCASCEKYFKTKSQLKSHKLSHKSDVSYTCDICKKSYKYKTNLFLHLKKHTGYTCPFCNLNCEKLSVLVKHRKKCNKNEAK
ncbi:zinc finger protein 84-like [Harmonia axyridis]|uniref:zinc finger protein 84-like n=1 Tax=Harmonia axyridis TaxID=115357 RepID=UPI001E275DCC|nr:zinc finger protein 84-like [Harmonia axyridis]